MGQFGGVHALTLPKVNRFGWNLEHCEYIVGGWPWLILGAICTVETFERQAKFCFFFGLLNNERFRRFPVRQILHLNTTTSIGIAIKTFGTEFWKFYRKGSFFLNKTQKLLTKCKRLAASGRHNCTVITDRRKFTTKNLYGISSFHFYR